MNRKKITVRTDYSRLSFSELVRWRGLFRAPLAYLSKYGMSLGPPRLLPQFWEDVACSASQFGEEFFKATRLANETLLGRGFHIVGYNGLGPDRHRPASNLQFGAIRYLHHNQKAFASLIYERKSPTLRSGPTERLDLAVAIRIGTNSISCTNAKSLFDPKQGTTRKRLATTDHSKILDEFDRLTSHRLHEATSIPSTEEFIRTNDTMQWEFVEELLRRGVYVQVDDEMTAP